MSRSGVTVTTNSRVIWPIRGYPRDFTNFDQWGSCWFYRPKQVFRAPVFRCSDLLNASNPGCTSGLSIRKLEVKSTALAEALCALFSDVPQAPKPAPALALISDGVWSRGQAL